MLPKELRQVVKLSGGKIIVSEGDVEESYVVMSLGEYLKERGEKNEKESDFAELSSGADENEGLTNEDLLDRINSEIAQLQQRKNEIQLEHEFEQEDGRSDYHYEQVRA